MPCLICHSEEIASRAIIEEIHHGSDIVQVQVQAMVCAACGERYYYRKTMRQLEAAKLSLATNSARLKETRKVLTLQ
jgi:YgiT-type zinc finger domain-containing protein